MATFVALRHPVTIWVADLTNPENFFSISTHIIKNNFYFFISFFSLVLAWVNIMRIISEVIPLFNLYFIILVLINIEVYVRIFVNPKTKPVDKHQILTSQTTSSISCPNTPEYQTMHIQIICSTMNTFKSDRKGGGGPT